MARNNKRNAATLAAAVSSALIIAPVELKADLSNLASYLAVEAADLQGQTVEGIPNPAAHVLPGSLTAVLGADARVQHCWKVYSEGAIAAGLRRAMLPPGVNYMSKNSTPEYNLLYQTVAVARFGKDSAALLGMKEAIKAGKDDERSTQQRAIGKVVGYIRGHIEAAESELTQASNGGESDGKETGTPRGTKKRTNAAQAAMDGQVIILLKDIKEAILNQPHATMTLTAFVKQIDVMLDKAKDAPEAKAA